TSFASKYDRSARTATYIIEKYTVIDTTQLFFARNSCYYEAKHAFFKSMLRSESMLLIQIEPKYIHLGPMYIDFVFRYVDIVSMQIDFVTMLHAQPADDSL